MQSNDDIDDGGHKGTDMRFEEDLYDNEKDEDDDDEYGKGGEMRMWIRMMMTMKKGRKLYGGNECTAVVVNGCMSG